LFRSFFLLGYFIEVKFEKMVDGPHLNYFSGKLTPLQNSNLIIFIRQINKLEGRCKRQVYLLDLGFIEGPTAQEAPTPQKAPTPQRGPTLRRGPTQVDPLFLLLSNSLMGPSSSNPPFTVHSAQYTIHSAHCTVHSAQQTVHSTQYNYKCLYKRIRPLVCWSIGSLVHWSVPILLKVF
jgi:hypothetical protein